MLFTFDKVDGDEPVLLPSQVREMLEKLKVPLRKALALQLSPRNTKDPKAAIAGHLETAFLTVDNILQVDDSTHE